MSALVTERCLCTADGAAECDGAGLPPGAAGCSCWCHAPVAPLMRFLLTLAAFFAGPWWRLFGGLDPRETAAMSCGVAPRDNSKGLVHAHIAEQYLAAVSPAWLAGVPVGDRATLFSHLAAMDRYEVTFQEPRVIDVLPGRGAETHIGHLDLWPQIETGSRAHFLGYGGVLVQTAYLCTAWEWLRCPKGRVRVSVLFLVPDKPGSAERALRLVWPDGAVIVVAAYDGDPRESETVRELRAALVDPPRPSPEMPATPHGIVRRLVLRDVAQTASRAGWRHTARLLLRDPSSPDLAECALVLDATAGRHQRQTGREHPVLRVAAEALRHLADGRDDLAARALAERDRKALGEWLRDAAAAESNDCDTTTTEAM